MTSEHDVTVAVAYRRCAVADEVDRLRQLRGVIWMIDVPAEVLTRAVDDKLRDASAELDVLDVLAGVA